MLNEINYKQIIEVVKLIGVEIFEKKFDKLLIE